MKDGHKTDPFPGLGEMKARMRTFDWANTPVGSIDTWSQSLKSTVRILLASRYPMILIWGPNLIQFYNDAYSQIIGDKHPAALGTDIRITLAEAWDTLGPMIEEVMVTGVANWVPAQMLVLERSGYREESYFSLSHAPAEDDSGEIVGMFCVCSEVTQQILGDRRLRLLRDLASRAGETRSVETTCRDVAASIAEHPLDVPFALIYLRDPDGKTLRLCGKVKMPEKALLSPVSVNITEPKSDIWSLAQAAAGETVLIEGVDSLFLLPGGPWNEPTRAALVMPIASSTQTEPLGVLVAGISPNRFLDEGYKSFYELLVNQVSIALRNAQAYEEERRRAEMLAELDRAKTAFFSNVSHEFRTPLTLMLGPLEDALRDPHLSTTGREQITIAHRNSLRLLKLVNTLLDFSRLEAGRTQAIYEPTDLATLTADLASVFRSAIEKAGLEFIVDCQPLSEPVYVDRDMWEKIVLNLLSNALKFTQRGYIKVEQRAMPAATLRNASNIELRIEDTGSGIPQSELKNVFKRFHRIEGTQARTHEGSGIGLALVQELAKLHGGSVRVESVCGAGSTFIVSIPRGKQHLPVDQIASDRTLTPTSIRADAFVEEALRWLPDEVHDANLSMGGGRSRILLADDNADMREYLRKLLSTQYEVIAVADGEAALAAVQEQVPDLVLSDVMMPKLDGFGLLTRLRQDQRTRSVPLILLSARAGEESRVEGLEAGADDYLVKPFSAREILARVKATLETARLRQETARSRLEVQAAQERAIILERVTDAFYGLDRQWRFTYVNQRCEEYIGKTRSELLGKVLWEEYPMLRGSVIEEQYYKAVGEQVAVHFEVLSPFSEQWVEVHAYPSADGLSVNFRYISDRKELEQRREALLESERAARTEAERVGRLKDEFLAVLSHEIRTPLNAILGWSQLLRKGKLSTVQFEKGLDTIERNSRAQAQILEDLLDMSRIISGKIRLNVKNVNLNLVIEEAIESFVPAVAAKDIRLQTVLDDVPNAIIGDPNRLQQVVWNLVSNAIKFTPTGGTVQVSVEKVNSHVVLTVSDTGHGIKPEFLPHVFDRFRQADSSTTRKFGGLGLGLSIVKHLVELHKGTIQATSPGEEQGATFTVVLPLAEK
ncbi:response regulator [Hassallia byssoidea VB512170]|uniref:Circadian input-output histidine kinase CikA n=1 Tax=Hassallia byssoidea VB512170 TaxID=1304833 RepID=A0A846H4N3_9CYAN|nr:ATP-binding protein [Hassalia byssoidea]NEU71521.1 response regulator [Hassalia byssoidea VB512170]